MARDRRRSFSGWAPSRQTTHHHGEQNHLEFLERPFQEAIQALHQRMHDLGVPH